MKFLLQRVAILFILLAFAGIAQADPAQNSLHASAGSPVDEWLQGEVNPLLSEPVTWSFAHPAPPVSLLPPVWQSGFDWLLKRTGGKFELNVFGSGTLYGATGGIKAIRSKVADYGTCYTAYEPKGFELLKTFHLPYVAPRNPYLTARIINEMMTEGLSDEFVARGVYPAHIAPARPLTLMSKMPITTPQDLKGKKVVSFMNAPGIDKDLGFSNVRLPFPEIYSALQQGIVDAVIWVDMGFIPFKIYEQAKYYTAINIAPGTIETCFNRQSFDRLSPTYKQEMYNLQQKIGIAIVHRMEQFSVSARTTLTENGVVFIDLDNDAQKIWQQAFLPSIETWMNDCESVGKDCRALAKKIKARAEKYAGLSNEELMRLAIDAPVQGIIKF